MILNLTQHVATEDQVRVGVFEPSAENKAKIKTLLNFEHCPSLEEIEKRAAGLAEIAKAEKASKAMIGGASYLMRPLELALLAEGIVPLYSFTKRVVVEKTLPDGRVEKVSVFQHEAFVEVTR